MEAKRGEDVEKIRPPKLEDAGLEDCALPLESIMEAFLKAKAATSPSAPDDSHSSPGRSSPPPPSDAVLDIDSAAEKGGVLVGDGDLGPKIGHK